MILTEGRVKAYNRYVALCKMKPAYTEQFGMKEFETYEDVDNLPEKDDPLGTENTREFAQELVDTCIERGILVDF